MGGSLGEVRQVLADVSAGLQAAHHHAGVARERIADAVAVLTRLGEEHSEPLVPEELQRAAEDVERVLQLIGGGTTAVADLDARL